MTDVTPDNDMDDDDGSFSAIFHGPTEHDDDMDPVSPPVPIAPHTVVGEFNADFGDGTVAGGFGARTE